MGGSHYPLTAETSRSQSLMQQSLVSPEKPVVNTPTVGTVLQRECSCATLQHHEHTRPQTTSCSVAPVLTDDRLCRVGTNYPAPVAASPGALQVAFLPLLHLVGGIGRSSELQLLVDAAAAQPR